MGNADLSLAGEHENPTGVLLGISNAMVRLYKEQLGRGPTRARTVWAGRDILLCTLEDSLTTAEHRLRERGQYERIRETRQFFQYEWLSEFVSLVETTSGRRVRAFVSGIDAEHDVATEVFYLHPDGEG
jgi:uncharacterized protein YbcI